MEPSKSKISIDRQFTASLYSADPHVRTTARLLAALFILRIPWIWIMDILGGIPPLKGFGAAVLVVGTAVLVTFLIWHEKDHLKDFHLDQLALLLLILGHPFHLVLILTGEKSVPAATLPLYSLLAVPPIWLIWKLRSHWKLIPRPTLSTLGWITAGIAAGVLMAFSARIFIWFQDARSFALVPVSISARDLLFNVFYQAANAALNEEPVFRAILWGYLARLNWPPLRILVFQAALFGFAHLDAVLFGSWVTPLIAFLYGLVFGWLVWRSKTIAPSIIAHGITNGIGTFLR